MNKKIKKEMLEDAFSEKRKRDFKKLKEKKYKSFYFEWLDEIYEIAKIKYPRHIIKDEKNVL